MSSILSREHLYLQWYASSLLKEWHAPEHFKIEKPVAFVRHEAQKRLLGTLACDTF